MVDTGRHSPIPTDPALEAARLRGYIVELERDLVTARRTLAALLASLEPPGPQ